MSIKLRCEQQKSEKYLESCGFELCEYQPHAQKSIFVKFIGEIPVYKTVLNGDILDGIVGD